MAKHLSYPMLVGFALLLPLFCSCAEESKSASVLPGEIDELVTQSASKPTNISDADIANYLAPSSDHSKRSTKELGVVMWQGPMLIAIENEKGEDLDLTSYPGNVIKSFVDSLAKNTGFRISITPAENLNNNVSIVVPLHGNAKGNAGALFGVHELSDKSTEFMSGLLKRDPGTSPPLPGNIAESAEEPDSVFNSFISNHVVKGCVIGISIKQSNNDNVRPLWNIMDHFASGCIGPWLDVRRLPKEQQRLTAHARTIVEAFNRHSFYFRKVWYSSGLEPGMSADTAQHRLLEHLESETKP